MSNEVLKEQDPYVRLARQAVECFITTGRLLDIPEDTPEELLKTKASVFVTIYKDGELRGRIGSIVSIRDNVAYEVIENAIQAAAYDIRFSRVTKDELPDLVYSVDVLSEMEEVSSREELDPEHYGIMVSSGTKQGIALPGMKDVKTADDQLNLCYEEGEIMPESPVVVYRFKVTHHE